MKKIIYTITALLFFTACKKQDQWLDVKSNKADIIPTTLKDFQALMDNNNVLNAVNAMGMISADNYFIKDALAQTGYTVERNAYVWNADIWEGLTGVGDGLNDWTDPYKTIEYANVVLDGIEKISVTSSNQADWNNLRGSALFYRSLSFFNLAQLFARPYVQSTAEADLGIPLRLSPDINDKVQRASVQQTYDQIIKDLNDALPLLPITPLYKTRPCQSAVTALLARVYLSMEEYGKAYDNADITLRNNSTLIKFNTVSGTPTYPFPTFQTGNPEVIFHALVLSFSTVSLANQLVDENLYDQYQSNDLRRTLFFRVNADGTKSFRGRYSGTASHFGGLATNELYLIKAECQARLGRINDSMQTLNALLTNRWATGTYVDYSATNETDALGIILAERRKELPFTADLRWEDLRRLNRDARFAKTLTRTVAGKTYTLLPNDKRYVLPIIPSEISLGGLQQNER